METKEGGIKADSAVEHRRMITPERTGKPKVVVENDPDFGHVEFEDQITCVKHILM